MKQNIPFEFEAFESEEDLHVNDRLLLTAARKNTARAYAPYSKFNVAATARLANGVIINGTNQENASYPVGLCAERTLLSAISATQQGIAIDTIAISYHNLNGQSENPVAPCGICRQTLAEYENRQNAFIRLILSGQTGKIYVISRASSLLPLSFSQSDME